MAAEGGALPLPNRPAPTAIRRFIGRGLDAVGVRRPRKVILQVAGAQAVQLARPNSPPSKLRGAVCGGLRGIEEGERRRTNE